MKAHCVESRIMLAIPRVFLLLAFVAYARCVQAFEIELPLDFYSMAEVKEAQGKASLLAVFTGDPNQDRAPRILQWISKNQAAKDDANRYKISRADKIPASAAAFDTCILDPGRPEASVLLLDGSGVLAMRPGQEPRRVVTTTTLMAYTRPDALPRYRLCFALIKGESPLLLVPRLEGVEVWRAKAPMQYERHALLPIDAQTKFGHNLAQRGSEQHPSQKLSLFLDLPSVTAIDYNGDGLQDLCLCREDRLACHTQTAGKGYIAEAVVRQRLSVLNPSEARDRSIVVDCRFTELTQDGRADFVMTKTSYDFSDMRSTVYLHPQAAQGGFTSKPAQVISRRGFFSYHEFFDVDGDNRPDLLAPVAPLSWTDLARIFLANSADIDFVYYKNLGQGQFANESTLVHHLSYPVNIKNFAAILGGLPLWSLTPEKAQLKGRYAMFFPDRNAAEVYSLDNKGELSPSPVWRAEGELGSEVLKTDLDGNGAHEILVAFGRSSTKPKRLRVLEPEVR